MPIDSGMAEGSNRNEFDLAKVAMLACRRVRIVRTANTKAAIVANAKATEVIASTTYSNKNFINMTFRSARFFATRSSKPNCYTYADSASHQIADC